MESMRPGFVRFGVLTNLEPPETLRNFGGCYLLWVIVKLGLGLKDVGFTWLIKSQTIL